MAFDFTVRPYAVCLFALIGLTAPLLVAAADVSKSGQSSSSGTTIERGRYLVKIAGCNDCHTKGYAESGGAVPEKEWLTGTALGWRGPWGTTYPPNLRLSMAKISEDKWIEMGHKMQFRPPMPWFALRDMSTTDLKAIYRFVRHLGPAGSPAPAFVPPGQTPSEPYVQFPG
jgi:hypothetical protein